ncbi:hypothetical protein AXX17_AT4G04340 [Arabidopsis thaliana]|uniref:Uncharacterized protein n=1 Tax=Arabidopsis thaliana TaxID=3702 RepID=A0A178UWJ2_ARATH|nr:hypothetical protein AXX17_AT4G04340 [Arabidopsis thaliana]
MTSCSSKMKNRFSSIVLETCQWCSKASQFLQPFFVPITQCPKRLRIHHHIFTREIEKIRPSEINKELRYRLSVFHRLQCGFSSGSKETS